MLENTQRDSFSLPPKSEWLKPEAKVYEASDARAQGLICRVNRPVAVSGFIDIASRVVMTAVKGNCIGLKSASTRQ